MNQDACGFHCVNCDADWIVVYVKTEQTAVIQFQQMCPFCSHIDQGAQGG